MLVLKIVAGVILLFALIMAIGQFYAWIDRKYRFDFFDEKLFATAFISNLLLYFGREWYLDALADNGDTLNGTVLMVVGSLGIFFIIYKNIKGTNFFMGLLVSCIQLPLFALGSIYGAIMAFALLAALGETKPVYMINKD